MTYGFRPASSFSERHGLFVALVGGTNSGKTYSALRLARGIAGPSGKIAVLDTEGGRTLHLKKDFEFDVKLMDPPFRPMAFAEAARAAEDAGYDCLLVDSFSMEWVGLGGVLDWQAEIHKKLGGNDSTKGLSWVEPKMAHKAMVYSFLQRRMPIIFAIRGEETFVPPKTKLFKPVCNKAFPFEVTVSFRLASENKGIIDLSDANAWKMEGSHADIFHHGEQLCEDHGARLAAWARGESKPTASAAPADGKKKRTLADLIAELEADLAGCTDNLAVDLWTSANAAKLEFLLDKAPDQHKRISQMAAAKAQGALV